VSVGRSTINRWAIHFLPLIEKMPRKYNRPVGGNWRMDKTYIRVKGVWKYLSRAVDKQGKTVDFLLTTKRDTAAAKCFLDKAMGVNGNPNKVAMDKSGANKAAIDAINAGRAVPILVCQVKYVDSIVERDHRAIKRITKTMLNFKLFHAAGPVLARIELVHMIRKGQFAVNGVNVSFAGQFSTLAGIVRPE
jgi:putative transposase